MPENPLLPNAQLQALHTLLTEAVAQKKIGFKSRKRSSASAETPVELESSEALLAGTVLQLCPGDILVGRAGDRSALRLSQSREIDADGAPSALDLPFAAPQLALAGALAGALRQASSDRIVFTLLSAEDNEANWAETLAVAQDGKHPLVTACADASGQDSFRGTGGADAKAKSAPWSWASVQRISGKLKLPILSVDGEDAVAVYRVMQESVLRARSGGGPAILWAMLPSTAELQAGRPKGAAPLRRLEQYLRARSIAFRSN